MPAETPFMRVFPKPLTAGERHESYTDDGPLAGFVHSLIHVICSAKAQERNSHVEHQRPEGKMEDEGQAILKVSILRSKR